MADITTITLNATAWREIINENFRLLNEEEDGGIPVYPTVPVNKFQDIIFVTNVGFMEWSTSVSPNKYVRNIVTVQADLNALAAGTSPQPKIQTAALKELWIPDYSTAVYLSGNSASYTFNFTAPYNCILFFSGWVSIGGLQGNPIFTVNGTSIANMALDSYSYTNLNSWDVTAKKVYNVTLPLKSGDVVVFNRAQGSTTVTVSAYHCKARQQ